jgi:hypothetical protein
MSEDRSRGTYHSLILFRFVDGIMGAWQRYFTHR